MKPKGPETQTITAIRASIMDVAWSVNDPAAIASAIRFVDDGLLLISNGRIVWYGRWREGKMRIPAGVCVCDYRGKLVVPGFVDAHLHYPQTEMLGAYGVPLLTWLQEYAFPAERRYAIASHARKMSAFFIRQLLRNGTTTAMVMGTVHPQSVDALFEEALKYNMRLIAGKVMMDRNAPIDLQDNADSSYMQSQALIERWHKRGRLLYAVTPRFAPTSTPEQLNAARRLCNEYSGTRLHTHLSENTEEIDWVKSLYPAHEHYTGVYNAHGLTGTGAVFAHCIHLEEQEWECLGGTGSAIAFCPGSNLNLGSGLFNLKNAWRYRIPVGIGTDIGGGTTFSLLQALNDAYKVLQLQGYSLSAWEAFYMITLGGARALGLEELVGNFDPGKEADFVVLDPAATPLLTLRYHNATSLAEKLFLLIALGDDRVIYRTYVDGHQVYERG